MRCSLISRAACLVALSAFVAIPSHVLADTKPAAEKVDINSATLKELETLPGVGAATAKKIIAGRPYAAVSDLSKAGVSAKTIEKITPQVVVGPAAAAAAPAAPAPAATPAAPAPTPAPAKAAAPTSPSSSGVTAQTPPVKGMVWVNLKSKVYHKEGDEWYGKTKEGKFMNEDDAIKAGYRLAGTPHPKSSPGN